MRLSHTTKIPPFKLKAVKSLLLSALLFSGGGLAHAGSDAEEIQALKAQLKLLQQKIEQLEANQQAGLEDRMTGVEAAVQKLQQPGSLEEAFEGASLGVSFLAVGQHAHGADLSPDQSNTQVNYRGDIEFELPLGAFQDPGTSGILFTHLRLGQGDVVDIGLPAFTGAVNSTAFTLAGVPADDSNVLLAQMWYQIDGQVNVSDDGRSFDGIGLTLGKIDPFVFFDGNEIADDESEYFVNNVFVHNPQLDSGGDIGADQYGFSPGAVLSYTLDANSVNQFSAKLGFFGAGNGSGFDDSLRKPFSIAQLSYDGKAFGNYQGSYSLYTWHNPQAENAITGEIESHSGVGLSVSQHVARYATVFSRLGWQTEGDVAFDSSLTGGLVLGGSYWKRPTDKAGFAVGGLFASDEYKAANPDSSGAEVNAEVFYTWQINDSLHVSPHFVHISRPAALGSSESVNVLGVRTKASF